jgi:predicted branched-subunit amino acid permease
MDRRNDYLRGYLKGIPVAISAAAYGLAVGATAAGNGVSLTMLVLQDLVLFAGAAQFVVVGQWGEGMAVGAIAIAVAALNLRYLLMTAALRPMFADRSLAASAPFIHLVADENWAVTIGEFRKDPNTTPWFLLGTGCAMITFWLAGTVVGHQVASVVVDPARFGIDFVFGAVFTALAVSAFQGKTDVVPYAVALAVSIVGRRLLPGTWYIVAGGLAGALAAASAPEPRTVVEAPDDAPADGGGAP